MNIIIGDIFKTYIVLYDHITEEKCQDGQKEFFPNIFKDLIINKEKVFRKFPPGYFTKLLIKNEAFKNTINMKNLNISTDEEIISLIKLLNYSMRTNSIDSISGKVSKEEARKNYLREIEILRKGVYKNNA